MSEYKMLTSTSSQYINPDYFQPLPTTLDAKKSPLALLAQTCSSIGKDSSSNSTSSTSSVKSLIPPLEKKDAEKCQEKSTSEGNKRDSKDKEANNSKPGFRNVANSKDIPPLVPVSSRPQDDHAHSPTSKSVTSSPRMREQKSNSSEINSGSGRPTSSHSSSSHHISENKEDEKIKRPTSSPRSPSRTIRENNTISDVKSSNTSASYPSSYGNLSSLGSYPHFSHAGLSSVDAAAAAAAHFAGYPLPLPAHGALSSHSAAAAALAAQSSAIAAQSSALKSGLGSSFSPFVTYTRVRTPSGATTLVPVCRDPYCTHCQLTEQNAHLSSTCNVAGCAQCAHEKSLQSLSLGLNTSLHHNFSPLSSSGLLSSLPSSSLPYTSSLYHHSALSGHSQSLLPTVCNWVTATGEQCGKRFSSSEELLQHLRSHTTASDPLSLAAFYDRYGFSSSALSGMHGHLGSTGSLSPNSLRRAYPTSLSPLSNIVGSNRYHPYKSLLTPPTGLSASQHPSTIGPYISPYSLYGQRIGAAAVP